MHDDPDVALMQAFAAGQEDAFVQLYQRYRDRVLRFSWRMLRNNAQAEEATQDVFLKLYRARDSYTPRSRFTTYLFRIAANHCLNLSSRHDQKLVRRDGVVPDEASEATRDALAQRELQRQLASALSGLPERQRAALVLVHYEGLSYQEASRALDVTEGAIKSLVHRAREGMMRELSGLLDAGGEVRHAV